MSLVSMRIHPSTSRTDGHNGIGLAGDCARAVWATIMRLDYRHVPHFSQYPAGFDDAADALHDEHGGLWYRRLRRWLRTMGYDAAGAAVVDSRVVPEHHPRVDGEPVGCYVDAGVWSKRVHGMRHAVVAWLDPDGSLALVHDPAGRRWARESGVPLTDADFPDAGHRDEASVIYPCVPYEPPPPDEALEGS